MTHHRQHNRLAVVLAAAALFVSVGATGGPALAKRVFAENSDKVDGKHAVGSGASTKKRRGKLVATSARNGLLPNNIIKKAPNAARLDGKDARDFLALRSPAGRLVAEGQVFGGNGALSGAAGSGVTASRSGTGSYSINLPGLRPGCGGSTPNVVATPFGVNEVSLSVVVTTCATGDVSVYLNTRNSAGTSTDGTFAFAIFSGNPVTRSPVARAAHGHPSVCEMTATGERCH